MSNLRTLACDELSRLLGSCIEKGSPVRLTHHSPKGWRLFRSSFTACCDVSQTIQIHARIPCESFTIPRRGDLLGLSFRSQGKKWMCSVPLISLEFRESQALLVVGWPETIQQLRRRVCERVQPPESCVIPVRLWPGQPPAQPDRNARRIRYGQLVNLSVGGMSVRVPHADEFQIDTIHRCAFSPRPRKSPIVTDVLIRHREAVDQGRACIGLQFVGLETTPDGQRILDSIAQTVTWFHRGRIQRR